MHTADSFDKMRSGLTLRSANFSRRGCISPISWLPERVSRNLIEINMHFRVHHNYCTFICVGMAEAISQSPSFILSLSYLFVKVSQSGPFIADDDDDDDVLPDVFLPRPLYGLFPISLSLRSITLSFTDGHFSSTSRWV